MFERFTERARQAVASAQDEARGLGHDAVGTEHLLLGLLRDEESPAARALDGFDVTLEEARAQVLRVSGRGDRAGGEQAPFAADARKGLELALRESLSLGHGAIGTGHLLLGLVQEGGAAATILRDFDLDADTIRREVVLALRRSSEPLPPAAPTLPPAVLAAALALALGVGLLLGWLIWA